VVSLPSRELLLWKVLCLSAADIYIVLFGLPLLIGTV
jgi:hypothetical protein